MREKLILQRLAEIHRLLEDQTKAEKAIIRVSELIGDIEKDSIQSEVDFHVSLMKEYDSFLLSSEKIIIKGFIMQNNFKKAMDLMDYAVSFMTPYKTEKALA